MKIHPLTIDHIKELTALLRRAHARSCYAENIELNDKVIKATFEQLLPAAKQGGAFLWGGFDKGKLRGALLAVRTYSPGTLTPVTADLFFYSELPRLGMALLRSYVRWGKRQNVGLIGMRTSFSTDEAYNERLRTYLGRQGFVKFGENYAIFMKR